jgi:hypothetical protein
MLRHDPRWRWLVILSIGNLVFWTAVAVAVGLLVSDRVDLGVETLVREQQATVVAVVEQAVSSFALPPEVHGGLEAAAVSAPAATATPPAGDAQPASGDSLPAAPGTQEPVTQPATTAASAPLLLTDPGLGDLARMNAEMSRSAPGRPVQITYHEQALNREISALLSGVPSLPYQDVSVDLWHDKVVVTGRVTILGLPVNARVSGLVWAEDCVPRLEVSSVTIAGFPTPRFVKDEIAAMLQEALDSYPSDHPLCLGQIVLQEDQATVYGYRR